MPVNFVFHKFYQFVSCLASIDKVSRFQMGACVVL